MRHRVFTSYVLGISWELFIAPLLWLPIVMVLKLMYIYCELFVNF